MWSTFRRTFKDSKQKMKQAPWRFWSVPVAAAAVGYVTNYIGVNMLFYPIEYTGINYKRWPEQPFGLFGWQGVVPCKRFAMCNIMVDVTLKKLLKISEVFEVLKPHKMADELQTAIQKVIYGGLLPLPVVHYFLSNVAQEIVNKIETLVDLGDIVVTGMTTDPTILGRFFQTVGKKELTFLVESGTYFGFLLGLGQMVLWMGYPVYWTLPIGGAVVGFITNWIAIKLIFCPVEPVPFGPLILQGMFLRRQTEVSAEFSEYLASKLLTSEEIWRYILLGENIKLFEDIIQQQVPFLTSSMVKTIVETLKVELISKDAKVPGWNAMDNKDSNNSKESSSIDGNSNSNSNSDAAQKKNKDVENNKYSATNNDDEDNNRTNNNIINNNNNNNNDNRNKHGLHRYIDDHLALEELFVARMARLTSAEFERILHPIFEEDELTLILAGGVLGMAAGALQWWVNVLLDGWNDSTNKLSGQLISSGPSAGEKHLTSALLHKTSSLKEQSELMLKKHGIRTISTLSRRLILRR